MKKIISIFAIVTAIMSCGSGDNKQAEALRANMAIDSMKTEMVKQKTIDSMNAIAAQPAPVSNESQVAGDARYHSTVRHHEQVGTTTNYNSTTNNAGAAPQYAQPAPVAAAPAQKKGWSDKAKGAVIGVGAGAVTGALLDKNKGAGALIGGAIGGAAGLGAGAILDKKKKDKEEAGQ